MELLYKVESPLPGIKNLEIFDFVLDGDGSYYPIMINGKFCQIKMDAEGFWCGVGLTEEICDYINDLIENEL